MGAENNHGFLSGGGEMGALIRAYNWHETSLGAPENWPQGLKTTIRLLLASGHPMFIFWGPDLIQFYNDAYRRSSGSERHPSALGQHGHVCWMEIWDIIGPDIDYVMSGKGSIWRENKLVPVTRDGRREDVYWTYSYNPIDDSHTVGGIGGVLVVCAETTAQVKEELRIQAAEARWRELFNQVPGFMCILRGPHHIFEFANPAYCKLVNGRDIIGKAVNVALPEIERQGFIALLDDVYTTGITYSGNATPVLLDSGNSRSRQQVYIDFVYQAIRTAEGTITGVLVAGYDVTERILANEKLRRADHSKDEFLAMLAHELRNPLAAIRNAGELLTATESAQSPARTIGGILTRQVTQLTRLVDDLLDVSRITHGRIELQREPVEIGEPIRLAMESTQPLFCDKRHEVIYSAAAKSVYVNGDLARLIQCLTNLLTNAAKYTNAGGRIEISVRAVEHTVVIEVADNGAGIAAEMLPNVFELFTQADRTLDRSQGGLGIGLSVVRRLIQMHGGSISAFSEGLGHGSVFRIVLPVTEVLDTPVLVKTEIKIIPKRILIVDDNADAANSLAQLLGLKGHETLAAYRADDALQLVQSFAPHLVLLDIGLPDMNGYEIARRLRDGKFADVIIALTGYGQAEDIEQARTAGFNAHVTKPVAFSDLEQILEHYCYA